MVPENDWERRDSLIFVELPGQLTPFQKPFDTPGVPAVPCRFVYLGNRGAGRFSGLLPREYDWAALGWRLADYFPMGYTNLYHFEKRLALHPDPERCGPYHPDRRRVPRLYRPKGLGPGDGEGRLYYVFRDPLSVEDGHDVIGLSFSEALARAKAERYVETHGRRALVGRLLETITWH